jgi:tetratricopeptide (TPR) repeat protein
MTLRSTQALRLWQTLQSAGERAHVFLANKLLCGALLGWLFLSSVVQSHAQDSNDQGFDGIDIPMTQILCFGMSGITDPNALGVCDALSLGENVRARELAQAWVTAQADSPAAQFALSEVLFRVEGNLPRALFHLNVAESLMDYTSLGRAIESGNLEWHYLTLSQLSYTHQLIGNQDESLRYLDMISQIYGQDVESFRGWPLIKLKRYDDARASAETVLANSDNPRDRSRAWNTLCAVELADLRPNESLIACENAMGEDESLALADADAELDTVHLLNASEVSLNLLRFDEAEAYLNRASRTIDPNSVGNPWVYKLYLYMNQARFDSARDALDRMLVWRDAQSPLTNVMNRGDHFMVSAIFLMLAGYPEDAARLTQAALNQPDRTGSYTADEAQKDSVAALVNSMAHQLRYERLHEQLATESWWTAWRLRIEAQAARFHAWRSGRLAASLFADQETLQNRMRPYAPLDVHIPEWIETELIKLMGAGVMQNLLNNAAAQGAFALNQGYFHSYQTEIAAVRGQHDLLRSSAEDALRLLPSHEVMLRARVSARLAELLWNTASNNEQRAQALEHYVYALRHDPSLFRRLGSAIPVNFYAPPAGTDSETFVSELRTYLGRSPRLIAHNQGLPLELLADGSQTLCLRDAGADALSCIQLAPAAVSEQGPSLAQALQSDAQRLVQQFHEGTFSLAYDLSRTERLALLGNSVIFSNQNSNPSSPQNQLLQR